MNETLKCFMENIRAAAEEDVRLVTEESAAGMQEELARIRREAEEKGAAARRTGIAQVQSAGEQKIAARETENRRKLLGHRQACAEKTMAHVLEKIRRYTTLPEYPERLVALTEKALNALGQPKEAVLYLRREDMGHGAYVCCRIKGVSLGLEEGDFALGGVQVACPKLGRRADMSFDVSLRDAESRFGQISGLGLE